MIYIIYKIICIAYNSYLETVINIESLKIARIKNILINYLKVNFISTMYLL